MRDLERAPDVIPGQRTPPPSVRDLLQAGEALQRELERAVVRMRLLGCSWAYVGAALGTSRQAAHRRWGYVDDLDGNGVEIRVRYVEQQPVHFARSLLLDEELPPLGGDWTGHQLRAAGAVRALRS